MVSPVLLIVVIFLMTYLAIKYSFKKPKNFPPGPPRVPLIGAYIFFLLINHKATHKVAQLFSKIYKSKIIGFYMGPAPTIVVHSYEAAKEVLNRKEFEGRPDILLSQIREPNHKRRGVLFNDGHDWQVQRRFILRYLRDYGYGRRFDELEITINEELLEMIDMIKNGPKYPHEERIVRKNQALVPYFLTAVQANSFFKVLLNERVSRADQGVLFDLSRTSFKLQRSGDNYGKLFSLIPWIRHIFPNQSDFKQISEANSIVYDYIAAIIDRHIETYDDTYVRNFIDLYIKEMKNEENTTFMYDQLVLGVVDFFVPVITSITSQISFFFLWLLRRPDVQKKIHAELDEVVGQGRLPNLSDRPYLHYTEATLREVFRVETLFPSNLPHQCLADTELLGYSVPKGSFIMVGFDAMHKDKDLWSDPENFRPERFLNEKGHFTLAKDYSLPFSAGRRLCAGETFSRNMMFLTITALCQNFSMELGPGEKLSDLDKTLFGFIASPPDFWMNLKSR